MPATIVSGIITGDALVSYWPIFCTAPSKSPRSRVPFAKTYSATSLLVCKVMNYRYRNAEHHVDKVISFEARELV